MYFLKKNNHPTSIFINNLLLLIFGWQNIVIFVFHLYLRINKSQYGCQIFTKDKRRIII
jgi:hypothetical protein